MPSFVTETAVDSGADSVTTGSLTEMTLFRLGWWSDFAVVALKNRWAAALVDSSTSATVQARDNALGCQTCIRTQCNATVTS